MVLDAIRMLLFPAVMAFAASSDLLTMTISNRLTLALACGFAVLAVAIGMSLHDVGLHLAAGGIVLLIGFGCFAMGWIGRDRAVARLRAPGDLPALCLAVRRRADGAADPVPRPALAGVHGAATLDHAAA